MEKRLRIVKAVFLSSLFGLVLLLSTCVSSPTSPTVKGKLSATVVLNKGVLENYDIESAVFEWKEQSESVWHALNLKFDRESTSIELELQPGTVTLKLTASLIAKNDSVEPQTWTNKNEPVEYTVLIEQGKVLTLEFNVKFNFALMWQNLYGESEQNEYHGYSIQQTSDNGYIIVGEVYSADEDLFLYAAKIDQNGTKQWDKVFRKGFSDKLRSVVLTDDGGYVVAGTTYNEESKAYVAKLDTDGAIVWEVLSAEVQRNEALSVQKTVDGGYIVAGYSYVPGKGKDAYVFKLNQTGNIQWQTKFGGNGDEEAYSVQQTNDKGYIVVGFTEIVDAGTDIYVLKIDENGELMWEKNFGGSENDEAYSVQQTTDGGYIVCGRFYKSPERSYDVYVLKLDENGNKVWEETFCGNGEDMAYSIQQTDDGGYILSGYTESSEDRSVDVYILRLNNKGQLLWEKTFGGENREEAWEIRQTADGGYVTVGWTDSFGCDGDKVYVIKMNTDGNSSTAPTR